MYAHLRDTSRWTLLEALVWQAQEQPNEVFLQVVDGDTLTFDQLLCDVEHTAHYLQELDVKRGDHVALFLPNGINFVLAWFGLTRLGAVPVPLNTELKGRFLQYQLNDCAAQLAIVDETLLELVDEIAPSVPHLKSIVVSGGVGLRSVPSLAGRVHRFEDWQHALRWKGPLPAPQDTATLMYTSGTTGPSKGVVMPHAHCFLYGLGSVDNLEVTAKDRYYITLPLFHANGLFMQLGGALIAGAKVILRRNFSASSWLSDVRQYGVTISNTLGVTSPFIFAQPPSDNDCDHHLRLIMAAPNPEVLAEVWRERFGVAQVLSGFGMTECNIPIWGRPDQDMPSNSAGLIYDRYFEVKIFNPNSDLELPPGEVGEIVVRPRVPYGFMAEYFGKPDKTISAWRNLWFHTGDAGQIDERGIVYFLDRIKDCIRRRGHNISSFEVEQAFLMLSGVVEVAAFAVPASFIGGEDEVMVALVLQAQSKLTPDDIARHGDKELPRFALPRFIEIVEKLPKTSTGKIQKDKLRERGIQFSLWDRETAAE